MDLTLPLDHAAIERILLHRYPFLFVDRITEFEVDKRIVGIKNVSRNERNLSNDANGSPVLPPTILTETVAQVGAIMILAQPNGHAARRGARERQARDGRHDDLRARSAAGRRRRGVLEIVCGGRPSGRPARAGLHPNAAAALDPGLNTRP